MRTMKTSNCLEIIEDYLEKEEGLSPDKISDYLEIIEDYLEKEGLSPDINYVKLSTLQKLIDSCNKGTSCYKTGCQYAPNNTDMCPLILLHLARRKFCREKNIPVERW